VSEVEHAARGIAHAACARRARLTTTLTLILSLKRARDLEMGRGGIEGEVRSLNGRKRLRGCCPHPRAPGALALSLDKERDRTRTRRRKQKNHKAWCKSSGGALRTRGAVRAPSAFA
jgi:hypothetical protein